MARIRTIKPEFFRHEALQDLQISHPELHPMLFFAGLWTLCDKAGRFEWKPRTIKLDVLPFLDYFPDASLALLRENGFIKQYESGGKLYGLVVSFEEHQRINGKEAQEPPKFPEPNGFNELSEGSNGEATGKQLRSQEGKGRERERERERSIAQSDEKSLNASTHQPDVITIPTNTGGEFAITAKHLAEYTALYPAVDVFAQLQAMRAWALSNPRLRKTPGGMLRFVNTWLSKEQNNARASPTRTQGQYQKPRVIESIRNAADDWMAQDTYAGGATYDA